jgi:Uma2 family endonuclease
MVELKFGLRTVDLPFTVRLYGVTEEKFDELVDEDTRAELLDGVMIAHSAPSPRHDDLAGFLRGLMRMYAEQRHLGKVLGPHSVVRLTTGRLLAPDVYFFQQRRIPTPLPARHFNGAPDLVVEVLSGANRRAGLNDKRRAYRQAGVQELWVVDLQDRRLLL